MLLVYSFVFCSSSVDNDDDDESFRSPEIGFSPI
jgi:hypothetical protein